MSLKVLLPVGFAVLFMVQAATAQTATTLVELRQAGWVQVDKKENDQWLPGIAPYENLRRKIYVATYTLQKDGEIITCTLSRDNMQDTSEQSCSRVK